MHMCVCVGGGITHPFLLSTGEDDDYVALRLVAALADSCQGKKDNYILHH